MQARSFWAGWARILQRWGLSGLAAEALESFGPLRVLAAQVLYFGQPLVNPDGSENHLMALAELLENSDESRSFADYLRERGD